MDESAAPDRLLEAIRRLPGARRGKLRVFLGLGPGVGKTYAMLEAAHQLRVRGVRVVVGLVETHGRRETAARLEGLEVLPRRVARHRGVDVHEMDLDALIAAAPAVAVVDELAHTNAPGARHRKRVQDVEELLGHGIDVLTTINVQHLESRNDEVARITGVRVRETVPDVVLEMADQIEVVDLPPVELLRRLSEGKIYPEARARQAAENFFKEEHLLALRELALRFVAEKVDQDLHQHLTVNGIKGPWNTNERLLVAVSHSPSSKHLIRRTRRMAYGMSAPWIALYVDTGASLGDADRETLRKNCDLARELGAELLSVTDLDVERAIQKVAYDRHVTQIIMGRPDRRPLRDFLKRGNLLDNLVRDVRGVDLHVIRGERGPRLRGWALPAVRSGVVPYYNVAWFMTTIAFACRALLDVIGYRALGSVFLVAILAVSALTTFGPVLFAAGIAAVVWDFFFIPPTWTFAITSFADVMMVVSFFVAAVVGGLLTTRLKRQEAALSARESEARQLYDLVRRLALVRDRAEAAVVLIDALVAHATFKPTVLVPGADGRLATGATFGTSPDQSELAVAEWTFANEKAAGWSTTTLSAARVWCLPMRGTAGVVGVLVLTPAAGAARPDVALGAFLSAVLTQTSLIFEAMALRESAEAGRLVESSARLHQTLLNSVSHELRTPITALLGTASALKTEIDPSTRAGFVDDIGRAARRLDRVVANLLDASRLEQGSLRLKREWFEVGELVAEVRRELGEDLGGRPLNLRGEGAALVEGDFALLALSIQQLVLNAVRYATPNTPIELESVVADGRWRLTVRDVGPGLPADAERVFEKFYRAPGAPAGGLGLGLAIVKSLVELHGGEVRARTRADGRGAEFDINVTVRPPPAALKEVLGE